MSRKSYDPTRKVVKPISELIEELTKLIMPKQPGSRPLATVWGVLCEASRLYREAEPDGQAKQDDTWLNGFSLGREAGQSYAAHVIIRKIADGMGVDNFKLREVPREEHQGEADSPPERPGPEAGGEVDQRGDGQDPGVQGR